MIDKFIFSSKICLILVSVVSLLLAAEYQVNTERKNQVKFISHAPMEDFEGITNKIDGYIFWEGDQLTNQSELYFEVDLNTLDTGIGLRNRHMREKYLETEKFPFTHFAGKLISAEQTGDSTFSVTAEGKMFIHGVENPLTVEGTLQKTGGEFRIASKFQIKLSDYRVKIPKLMFFKIDETMRLELDFYVKKVQK